MEDQLLPCRNFNTMERARCQKVVTALKIEPAETISWMP